MSSWKKASKINQKTHRERKQPEHRASLGILPKKKDYKLRANDYNNKKKCVQNLKLAALNRNPDEFYFHMVNSRVKKGKHEEIKKVPESTIEQTKLLSGRNMDYISFVRNLESKKIDKLQAQFHMIDIAESYPREHKRFDDAGESSSSSRSQFSTPEDLLDNLNMQSLTKTELARIKQERVKIYKQIRKRVNREKELTVIQRKLEIQSALKKHKGLKPKLVKRGSYAEAPVFEFKYERKR